MAGVVPALANLPGRQRRSLNGEWQALIDAYAVGMGDWKAVWRDRTAAGKHEFYEYGFDDNFTLQVPGDFNTQRPQLTWLEGSVWYRKGFNYGIGENRRLFVHFGAANYRSDVFLNGERLGSHEGGFTPYGANDVASDWNEELQAEFYRRQLQMLRRIPFLRGVAPWVLADFRSPVRLHPLQEGHNRKGLLSEHGERKQAWQVIHDYYRAEDGI